MTNTKGCGKEIEKDVKSELLDLIRRTKKKCSNDMDKHLCDHLKWLVEDKSSSQKEIEQAGKQVELMNKELLKQQKEIVELKRLYENERKQYAEYRKFKKKEIKGEKE